MSPPLAEIFRRVRELFTIRSVVRGRDRRNGRRNNDARSGAGLSRRGTLAYLRWLVFQEHSPPRQRRALLGNLMTGDKLYGGKYETFAEWVKAEPDKFDSQDCRPGPSGLDPEYSDSLIPECVREKTLAVRRQ